MRCNVRNRMKFGKISRKEILCTKKENGYREFDHKGMLNLTLVEGEAFLSLFEAPSEGSNRQNRTKDFISRITNRSIVRIKSSTRKQNRCVNSADFHAHKTKVLD